MLKPRGSAGKCERALLLTTLLLHAVPEKSPSTAAWAQRLSWESNTVAGCSSSSPPCTVSPIGVDDKYHDACGVPSPLPARTLYYPQIKFAMACFLSSF